MPETRFLHIQARGRGPVRVIELPSGPIRVGRGLQCEIRLGDPGLAEVECLLRSRGEVWHVQPLNPDGKVSIDGRPVSHLRALPVGVALEVGDHWLTLRPGRKYEPTLGIHEIPESTRAAQPVFSSATATPLDASGDSPLLSTASRSRYAPPPSSFARTEERAGRTVGDPSGGERWLKSRADQKPWEARWRSAGESLRARREASAPPSPAPESQRFHEAPIEVAATIEEPSTPEASAPLIVPFRAVTPVVPEPDAPAEETVSPSPGNETSTDPSLQTWAIAPCGPEVIHSSSTAVEACGETIDLVFAISSAVVEEPKIASNDAEVISPPAVAKSRTEEPIAPPRKEAGFADLSGSRPIPDQRQVSNPVPVARPTRPRRSRSTKRGVTSDPIPSVPEIGELPEIDEVDWPSARVILADHASRVAASSQTIPAQRSTPNSSRPVPTDGQEPPVWRLSRGLAVLPALASLMLVGLGLSLAWIWGGDDREAGVIADRLLRADHSEAREELVADTGSDAAWWRTTAGHLSLRAAAIADSQGDPARADQSKFLLNVAQIASPLESSARLARARAAAQTHEPGSEVASLGMSRDSVALAWMGRELVRAGKVEAATRVYHDAIALASDVPEKVGSTPVFLDEAGNRRFGLPGEAAVTAMTQELAEAVGWDQDKLLAAIPDHPLALLVSYRVLRDHQTGDVSRVLDRLAASSSSPSTIALAARAEGLSLSQRHEDAANLYRDAIASTSDEATRRILSFNFAAVLGRAGEKTKMLDALVLARGERGDDEISRRAGQEIASRGFEPEHTDKTKSTRN